jgi:transcriptional regulator with XRE-family HTH domain
MKERLKKLRKFLKLTQGEFGKKIGMSDVAISYMESGRTALSKQNIRLICLALGVNEEWLEKGAGDMMDDEAMLSEWERHILNLYRKLSPRAQTMLVEYADKLLSDEQAIRGGAQARVDDEAPDKRAGGKAPHPIHEQERA